MINFSNAFSNEWNKKVVYAPNGFGKTTNSIKLNDYYKSINSRPLIFTRKRIESLVQNYGNIIFFGESALNAEENKKIIDKFNQSNNIKKFFKDNYGSQAIKIVKQSSFFVQMSKFKSFDDFNELIKIDFNCNDVFNETDSIRMDKIIDYKLYEQVSTLLDSKDNIKKIKVLKRYQIIDENVMQCIETLKAFAISNNNNNCPLCGKRFASKEKLIDALEKKYNKYKIMDRNNPFSVLAGVTKKIHNLYYEDSQIHNILYDFDETLLVEITGMIKLISNYDKLCKKVYLSMAKCFGNIQINNGQSLMELKSQFMQNEKKIFSEKTNITNVKAFTRFIINELEEIISVDNNISFSAVPNKLEVIVLFSNQPVSSLYDVLSESEIKRFSLVVLRALIRYGKYDTLILDDPIDSYDDYYSVVACEYIANIVKESKLVNWFILTNNFTALTNISSLIKCDSIIYYYVPDDIFTSNNFQISSFSSTYKEIEEVSKNELHLLRNYLKGTLNADSNLAYVSFIVTLRNFNSLVLKNYDRLLIKQGSKIYGTISTYDTDINYSANIKMIIEHYFMHYDEKIETTLGFNSNSIEVKRIIDLYNRICKAKKTLVDTYTNDCTSLCDMRKIIAKSQFNTFVGSKILNLIFVKICIVSYLKYEFEKQLIVKLKTKYHYSNNDIDIICKVNALRNKIDKAKELSSLQSYRADNYLNDYLNVFNKNMLLFNLFDHALEQMFPPYIATNVKDIRKFRIDIDRLEITY